MGKGEYKAMKTTLHNWLNLNREKVFYQFLALFSVLTSCFLAMVVLVQLGKLPIVVIQENEKRVYQVGNPKGYELTEGDVKNFVARFIKSRYNWTEFHPQKILEKITCLTTRGFRQKLAPVLGEIKHDEQDKRVEQYAAFIRPILGDTQTIVNFDRVLRIDGIPLATPTKMALDIIQGEFTPCNPVGLYVHGATEYKP